jgi:hypothetical protein
MNQAPSQSEFRALRVAEALAVGFPDKGMPSIAFIAEGVVRR